jgi:hypothetical protein
MDRFIWHTDETLEAAIDLAHYAPGAVEDVCDYELTTDDGAVLASGSFAVSQRERGVAGIGRIGVRLGGGALADGAPVSAVLRASLREGGIENAWRVWIYPRDLPAEPTESEVLVARSLDDAALDRLRAGGRVALFVDPERVAGDTFGTFRPIFWNRVTFPSQREHVVGLLVDDEHPALDAFPTATHQDWQWWDAMADSKPMLMGFTATPIEPIVRAIDDWYRARGLAFAFECLVPFDADTPPGRLLVCSIDLHEDLDTRPAARQLRSSLLGYAASDAFAPTDEIPLWELRTLFRKPSAMQAAGVLVTASSAARRVQRREGHRRIGGHVLAHAVGQPAHQPAAHAPHRSRKDPAGQRARLHAPARHGERSDRRVGRGGERRRICLALRRRGHVAEHQGDAACLLGADGGAIRPARREISGKRRGLRLGRGDRGSLRGRAALGARSQGVASRRRAPRHSTDSRKGETGSERVSKSVAMWYGDQR